MASLLNSTLNTRFLPAGGMRYVRSDVPVRLTDADIHFLLDNSITTVVDLRSCDEVRAKPCVLAQLEGFCYHHMPVTGGGDVPETREQLHASYAGMADSQMKKILDVIMTAKTNVLFFCTAGKDRTGVVAALILRRLGCDDKTIIDDYMLSADNLSDMLASYAEAHPEVDPYIITPHRENMERFLETAAKQ